MIKFTKKGFPAESKYQQIPGFERRKGSRIDSPYAFSMTKEAREKFADVFENERKKRPANFGWFLGLNASYLIYNYRTALFVSRKYGLKRALAA